MRALMQQKVRQPLTKPAAPWDTFTALLGRSLAVERLTLNQVGGVRIPAPQPSLFLDTKEETGSALRISTAPLGALTATLTATRVRGGIYARR